MKLCILADASSIHTKRWIDYFAHKNAQHSVDWSVFLISLEKSIGTKAKEYILHSKIKLRFLKYPISKFVIQNYIREIKPDIINAHFVSNYGLIAALIKSSTLNIPLVISCWGSDILNTKTLLHKTRIKFALSKADLITVDANILKEKIIGLGIKEDKIINVPMGIDTKIFNSDNKKFTPPFHIVNLRLLEKIYNHKLFLSAIYIVLKKLSNVKIFMLQSGTYSNKIINFAKKLGISHNIEFLPYLPHTKVAEILKNSQIYVSTSIFDSTSVTLLEAMACGCFPIVSDIAGNREWISDNENGFLFSLGKPAYLANKIIQAINSPDLLISAMNKNKEIIAKRAIWQNNLQEIEKAFINLI